MKATAEKTKEEDEKTREAALIWAGRIIGLPKKK
jgi:hypothetical protein